ncbi:trigger factor [bacterium 210820-DFI.6.37]|nr:trigger factor [bacterium 210820-DFI.6.37]
MKKKAVALALAVCLLGTMGLTGCGSKPYSNYDLSEYVKVGQYKGLEMEAIKVSVSDEEVDAQVETNVENTKTTEKKKEGKVAKKDKVNIDYEGKINGKTFDGGSAEGYDLTIGSGSFIDGFEDGLIGKKVGSTQELKLKFPDDYQEEDVAGKDVVFTVKINYISEDVIPEYNDAWVAKNSDVKTVSDYEKLIKDQLLEDKEEEAKNTKISELWSEVTENSEVLKYPEEEVNTYIEEIENQYQTMADSYGLELKDLWEQYGIESEEDYDAQNKEAAQAYVKEQMILYSIAEQEDLSYSKDEEEELRDAIDKAGYTEETFKQNYGQDIDSYVEAALTFQKVGEFLFDNAKTVEKKTDKSKDKEESKESTEKTDTEKTNSKDDGSDDATSNDEAGGADA